MNILMIGNSFTYFNDMPGMLAKNLNASVTEVVRGGAYLHDMFNPNDALSGHVMDAISGVLREGEGNIMCKTFGGAHDGKWDYIVIQEQSFNAVGDTADFMKHALELCKMARAAGAQPILYESWAYRDGSEKLKAKGLTYEQMRARMLEAYLRAADESGALIAKVGEAFARANFDPYVEDDYHPNETGSRMAARVIASVINKNEAQKHGAYKARSDISLRQIDRSNWFACTQLSVSDDQREFVASNSYSLAQAAYEPEHYPFGIYMGDDMVGFAMYCYDAEMGMWEMCRLMLDKKYQHSGIGRTAAGLLLDKIVEKCGHVMAYTSSEITNYVALGLYERMGFAPDGRIIYGEFIMTRQL